MPQNLPLRFLASESLFSLSDIFLSCDLSSRSLFACSDFFSNNCIIFSLSLIDVVLKCIDLSLDCCVEVNKRYSCRIASLLVVAIKVNIEEFPLEVCSVNNFLTVVVEEGNQA